MTNIKEPIHFGLTTISQEFFQLLRDGCSSRDVINILGRSFVISTVSVKDDPVMPQAKASFAEVTFLAWVGVGLPPIGTVCEMKRVPHGDWGEAIVRFSSSNVIVWDWTDEPAVNGKCTAYAHEVECRPIRTPEQIAAEEREAEIIEIERIAISGENNRKTWASALYDAGYRKQVRR